MKILVRRTGAFGDVLDTTPVLRRLRQENPDAEIDIETSYSSIYWNSPHRIGAKRTEIEYDRFIDLDMAFENLLRRVNVVEAYMEVAFGDRNGSTQLEITYDKEPPFDMDWSKTITMHAYNAPAWPQRTLPHGFWTDLADRLTDRGWLICCIGTQQDFSMKGRKNIVDTTRLQSRDAEGNMHDVNYVLSPQAQASIINASRAFVCCGSGPMMLAQCTDAPIVAMEAISLPYMFERDRHGVKGWRMNSIMPEKNGVTLNCIGCSGRMEKPTTYFHCPRTDKPNECMELFDPVDIADKVEEAAHNVES